MKVTIALFSTKAIEMFSIQDLEIALDDERRAGDEARQAVTLLERKRIALQTELEDVRSLLETVSEKPS